MRITIALEEPLKGEVAHVFELGLTMCDLGLGLTKDAFLLDRLLMNEYELKMLKEPLCTLWQVAKEGNGVFDLNEESVKVLRTFASVSRTLNCTKSLCKKVQALEITEDQRRDIVLLYDALQWAESMLNTLHYLTRSVIWTIDSVQEAGRYEIKCDNGAWYVFKDGKPWSTFGHESEWEALDELKGVKPAIVRYLQRRNLLVD